MVGGASAELSGGSFKNGFISAGVTQAFAPGIDGLDSGNSGISLERTLAAAVVGGTASKLTGGKFANGAFTGAFSRLFNDEATEYAKKQIIEHLQGEIDVLIHDVKTLSSVDFEAKYGISHDVVLLYEVQLGRMKSALNFNEIYGTSAELAEVLISDIALRGLGRIAKAPKWYNRFNIFSAEPKFDTSGFGVDCRGVHCGFVRPEDEFIPCENFNFCR